MLSFSVLTRCKKPWSPKSQLHLELAVQYLPTHGVEIGAYMELQSTRSLCQALRKARFASDKLVKQRPGSGLVCHLHPAIFAFPSSSTPGQHSEGLLSRRSGGQALLLSSSAQNLLLWLSAWL